MTEPLLDLYVIDPDRSAVNALIAGLGDAGLRLFGSHTSADAAVPALLSTCPQVIVVDVGSCGDIAATVRRLVLACPDSCVVVTGTATPPAIMSRAVASGARGFLIKPYQPADLFATIREAIETSRTVALRHGAPATRERARGKIIAVYSPKGGVGSTTVATNLAVALATRPRTAVALVDLDLQFGDVGTALDLRGANSVAEVATESELTAELIDETFVRHRSGVRALLAPDDLSLVEDIDPDQVSRLLSQLRSHFDYIVADLWSSFETLTMKALRASDRVLIVTTPELPSVRNVQRILRATHADLDLGEKAIVVVNRYPGKAGLSLDDVSKALGMPIAATIPSEGATVTEAINRGLSLLDARSRVRIARHYHQLAATVADGVATAAGIPHAGLTGAT